VVTRKANMVPNCPANDALIAQHRKRTEPMGLQRLRARTNEGFFLKVQASLLALI